MPRPDGQDEAPARALRPPSPGADGAGPRLVVLSSLFPSAQEPLAGIFIRERMFRVARELPVQVVAPVAWFPLQGALRLLRPHFRRTLPVDSVMDGIRVERPRYFSVPGPIRFDGRGMALGALPALRRILRETGSFIIDAHFGYPDGYAAHLLARRLGLPYVVTLRGTEIRHSRMPAIRRCLTATFAGAARVFSVSESLRGLALELGAPADRAVVVPNGIDLTRFSPVPRADARRELGLPEGALVLVTVGGLVRRKGFHRVIRLLRELRNRNGDVRYLVVGGASREGDDGAELKALATACGVADAVHFLGALPPDRLKVPLSAADLFVLASDNEGWANVLLESMACGTPVVASDVGGNAEVVADRAVGDVVSLAEPDALRNAITAGLTRPWDREGIIAYARRNSWDARVARLIAEFRAVAASP